MFNYIDLAIAFIIALLSTFLLTFVVNKFAVKIGAVDLPNDRKIHKKITPRLGGLAIFLGAFLGALYLQPQDQHLIEILCGAIVIVITGALDDRFTLRPIPKLTGQLIATSFLVSSGLIIDKVTLPFIGQVELGFMSVLVTVIWVVGITNAINLIDGLDGLATGVTTIALISLFVMGIIDGRLIVVYLCIALIGANLGFLYHNFYPAKIYMGDTGSNLLGYMIAVISILGLFKNIALFSFVIPIIVLAVPIFDTLFAIVRRMLNKQSILKADNKHIHYQLLAAGYSHRKTVLILYGISAIFGTLAVIFNEVSITMNLVVIIILLFLLHILAELAGLVFGGKRPVLDTIVKLFKRKVPNQEQ
ncbi:undecaprenyl/decaprenyl-phosphate alpha-N-acetylglucosaminyl 1-phosphate transferase [Ornithinibacillus sp. BX22]|uniref:Undecaprenyl/decaprenyl-phosphate alpha-N-acetylglucosaminyl 1-phosphate transferase n=2 Tax=Ornithinibacillus TaxID=484508 RepID=A0A923L3B9_9BACI|nr:MULTISPECIES: MraY family glycosyltransferase [Ornithinibacillus]MBC5635681.1 undecaprenyl/decaprenyl-phosphate alpha-N-acetylglucosaminyl 1-phosphate transferase [Ornithinibacillus hominis]MBS3679292.1 undecaprenyl/decaprenyl-phosphate alpha-N-acetylglucosaminyl 1-phosphate transferase [Ornithinibacillus massiliensis]